MAGGEQVYDYYDVKKKDMDDVLAAFLGKAHAQKLLRGCRALALWVATPAFKLEREWFHLVGREPAQIPTLGAHHQGSIHAFVA